MNRIIQICLLILIFTSCEKVLDMDVPEDQVKLVVNSYFTPDSTWDVFVGKSRSILDTSSFVGIEAATVGIYEGETLIETLAHDSDGYYSGLTYPKPNVDYRVEVAYSNFPVCTGTDKAPPILDASISIDTNTVVIMEGEEYYAITVSFLDLPGAGNYYAAQLRATYYEYVFDDMWEIIDSNRAYTPMYFVTRDPVADNGGEEKWGTEIIQFSDELFDGSTYELELLVWKYEFGEYRWFDDVEVILSRTSEDYYRYEKSANAQERTKGGLFSEPAQVFSNIENGFGIFAGYSSARDNLDL